MVAGGNSNSRGFVINEVKCPSCGGSLVLEDGADFVKCGFCGSTVHVSYRKQETGIEPDGTIRDRSTGYGLFCVRDLPGWQVSGTALQRMGSSSRPFIAQAQLRNCAGGVMNLRLGDAGVRNSAGMTAFMSMYGGHLAGVDTTNYADVPDPLLLADATAAGVVAGMGATDLRFVRQYVSKDLEAKRQETLARFQREAQSSHMSVSNPLVAVVLRTYAFTMGGQAWKLASYVTLEAVKTSMGLGEGFGGDMMEGLGDLMGKVGGMFGTAAGVSQPAGQQGSAVQARIGQQSQQRPDDPYQGVAGFLMGGGLLGKMKRERQAAAQIQYQQPVQMQVQPAQPAQMQAQPAQAQAQAQPAQAQSQPAQAQSQARQAASQGAVWCLPDYSEYVKNGTIYWGVPLVATLAAPADDFDGQFEKAFMPLLSAVRIHPDVESLSMQVARQESMQIQQVTQSQLARNEAAFQAQQAAHRQTQAAYDSYNRSIAAASDARHQQFRAATNAQFNMPSGGGSADFSEAIRGVNTYVTSDGREVELSVHADRAYENQAGDVIGTSSAFGPGADWSEIPRV